MQRYVIENRINTVKDLVQFDLAGYSYNKNESSPPPPVFFRKSS